MNLQAVKRAVPTPRLDMERYELSCGATLLVSPRENAPVTAMHVHLRGLLANDVEGREGTAYLSGALLDQGTAKHNQIIVAFKKSANHC